MKNKNLRVVICLLASSIIFSSCIGSFSLWHKVLKWNQSLGDKFVNELVFVVFHIVPVYEVAGFIDAVVLNTIEFWTGDNPVTSNIGKTQTVMGQDGKQYVVKNLKNGYKVTKPNGQTVNFTYNKTDKTWTISSKGKKAELFKMNEDGTAQITLNNGKKMNVSLDSQGIYEAQMAVQGSTYYAAR